MQREKLYNLHKTANFTAAVFAPKMDKILSNQISTVRKWDHFFGTRRIHSLETVELFALHLLVYFVFQTEQSATIRYVQPVYLTDYI
jgi:hypothetical protein